MENLDKYNALNEYNSQDNENMPVNIKDNIKTTKDELYAEAVYRCYKEMYANAQPSVDYDVLLAKAKNGEEDPNHPFYSQHYLSHKEYQYILEKYVEAYGLKDEFPNHCDTILRYFDEGIIDKYIERKGDQPGYRGYEHLKSLKDLIGEEHYNIVVERVKQAKDFYRFNRDECGFHWAMMNCSPSCNAEAVKKYWKEHKGIDIDIVERSEDDFYYRYYCGETENPEESEDMYSISEVQLPQDCKDERSLDELIEASNKPLDHDNTSRMYDNWGNYVDFEHNSEKYEVHE